MDRISNQTLMDNPKTSIEPSRGVFWVIGGKLFTYPFYSGYDEGIAKSGNTYNHAKLWPLIRPHGCSKRFDHYPRGRVDFNRSGQSVIYMSPHIDDSLIPMIIKEFGLQDEPKIHYDFSKHYRCYLDGDHTGM